MDTCLQWSEHNLNMLLHTLALGKHFRVCMKRRHTKTQNISWLHWYALIVWPFYNLTESSYICLHKKATTACGRELKDKIIVKPLKNPIISLIMVNCSNCLPVTISRNQTNTFRLEYTDFNLLSSSSFCFIRHCIVIDELMIKNICL